MGTDKDGLYLFDIKTGSIKSHLLSNTTVLALCKDKKGRTWVGTYTDGIGLIDAGGSFHPFSLGIGNQAGIFDIQEDPQGNVWFATMGKGLLLMFIFCLTAQNMMAQRGKLFNSDNQLSSNLATQVFQDSNGFIWIATRNGLNIYDGYNFMVIRKAYNNSNGLNSNYINCITQDEKGRIVLGTNKSLLILNGKRFCNVPMLDSRNKPINTYVTQVSRLHNGDIAVVTSGYGIMTKKIDANACYTMKGEVEKLKFVHKILEDKQERLWIILENGKLYRKEKNGKIVSHFAGTENAEAQDIRQDNKGNIYLATKNDGVYLLKAGSTAFTKIAGIGNLPIANIYISRDQRLFIGCDGMGIFVYNPVTGFLQNNPLFCHEVNIAKSKITSIIEDFTGNIWVSMLQNLATKNDGVYLLKAGSTAFTKIAGIGNLPIANIYISRDQRLFIGCDGMGIFVYNPVTGFLQNNPLFCHEVNIAKSKITSIIEDFTGNIWVSMLQKGVFMQSQAQCDFNYMGYRLDSRNVIGENSITSLCANQGDQVWVGTDKDGLYLFDIKTGSIKSHLLSNTTVLALCKDKKGRTWVGTYTDGIGLIDAGGSFHPFSLGIGNQAGIFDIQEDPQGNVWFATMGKGLFRLSPDGSIKQWEAQDGADNNLKKNSIPNDYLINLSISKDGKRVFVATSVGLACYDQQKNSWTSTFGGVNCLSKGSFSLGEYAPEGRIHAVAGSMRFQLYGLPFGQPQRDRRKQHHKSVCQPGRSSLGGHRQGWSLPL